MTKQKLLVVPLNFFTYSEAYLRTVRRSAIRGSRGKGSEAGQLHYVIYNVQVGICEKNTAPQLRTLCFVTHLNSVQHCWQKHPPVFLAFVSVGETRLLMTAGFLGTLLRTTELQNVLSCSASALCRNSAACWGLLGCVCCSEKKGKIFTDYV